MERIILQMALAVIILDELPPEIMLHWIESMKKSIPKMEKNLKKAVRTLEDFMKKMVGPGLKGMKKFIDPNYVGPGGLTIDQIIQKAEDDAPGAYKKYKKKIDNLFKTVDGVHAKEFIEMIMHGAMRYAEKMRLQVIPFIGYGKQVRGVARLAPRFLTGDKKAIDKLIQADKIRQSGPVDITRPARSASAETRRGLPGKLRQKLFYRLRRAGSRIMKALDKRKVIKMENDLTNQLVNKFIRPDIVPFTTGGNSHIDFVIIDGNLYLDIQVTEK